MPSKPIYQSSLDYYVYAYIRRDGTPYYIGKGKGKRAFSKQHSVFVPNKDSGQIVILERNLTEVGALAIERRLIRLWGKKESGGLLRNKADGGEGSTGYGRKLTLEHRLAISKSMKGRVMTEQHKRRLQVVNIKTSKKRKGSTISSAAKEKISKAMQGRVMTDEHKRNLSKAATGKKHPVKSVTCPHCMKTGNPGGMANYHFDNCKSKP